MDASVVISLVAVILSALAFWRSELRGPRLRLLAVPGSTTVGISPRHGAESDWTMVNIHRSVLVVNYGPVPGFVSQVLVATPQPPGLTINWGIHAGVVRSRGEEVTIVPEPFARLDSVVQRDDPLHLIVGLWFDCLTSEADAVRAYVRDANGPLYFRVELDSLERGLRGDHFKRRHLNMRPKADPTELIGWSSFAMSIGLKPPDGSDHADEPHAQTATIRGGPEAEVLRNLTPSTRALVLELVRASPPDNRLETFYIEMQGRSMVPNRGQPVSVPVHLHELRQLFDLGVIDLRSADGGNWGVCPRPIADRVARLILESEGTTSA